MKNLLILIVLCMLGNLGFAAADRELQPCQYLVKVNFYRENGKVELEASSLEVPVFPGEYSASSEVGGLCCFSSSLYL